MSDVLSNHWWACFSGVFNSSRGRSEETYVSNKKSAPQNHTCNIGIIIIPTATALSLC